MKNTPVALPPRLLDFDALVQWAEKYDNRAAEGWLSALLSGEITLDEMRNAVIEDRAPRSVSKARRTP